MQQSDRHGRTFVAVVWNFGRHPGAFLSQLTSQSSWSTLHHQQHQKLFLMMNSNLQNYHGACTVQPERGWFRNFESNWLCWLLFIPLVDSSSSWSEELTMINMKQKFRLMLLLALARHVRLHERSSLNGKVFMLNFSQSFFFFLLMMTRVLCVWWGRMANLIMKIFFSNCFLSIRNFIITI